MAAAVGRVSVLWQSFLFMLVSIDADSPIWSWLVESPKVSLCSHLFSGCLIYTAASSSCYLITFPESTNFVSSHTILKGTEKIVLLFHITSRVPETLSVCPCTLYNHSYWDGDFCNVPDPKVSDKKLSKSTLYSQMHRHFWRCSNGLSRRMHRDPQILLRFHSLALSPTLSFTPQRTSSSCEWDGVHSSIISLTCS